ncbi:unnamed protein product [Sphagnum balticum]
MASTIPYTVMEGFTHIYAKLSVYLHPSRAANVQQGVREIMNSLLLRYNEEFEGVVLAYLDPKIQGRTANILSGLSPYFHVQLKASFLLFSPKIGMLVEGKVNKVEKDYLGVVVLGLFNAAIGIADIREDLYYDDSGGMKAWQSESDHQHSIGLGSNIRFIVKSVQETEEIIDLCGSLQAVHTGCVKWLDRLTMATRREETSSPQSRPLENGQKKSKHKQTTKEESRQKVSEGANEADTVSHKKRRKKKRDLGEDENVTSHKSKRKKSDAGAG